MKKLGAILLLAVIVASGCTRNQRYVGSGAAAGAAVGHVIGEGSAASTVVGAGLGAAAGAIIEAKVN